MTHSPPATIRVLHLEFDLRFVDGTFFDAAGAYGHCDKKRLVISICKNLQPALLADTTLHECIHAMHFAVGCAPEMPEEDIALQFAGPLCMLLRDNPQFFDWVQWLLSPLADDGPSDVPLSDRRIYK